MRVGPNSSYHRSDQDVIAIAPLGRDLPFLELRDLIHDQGILWAMTRLSHAPALRLLVRAQ